MSRSIIWPIWSSADLLKQEKGTTKHAVVGLTKSAVLEQIVERYDDDEKGLLTSAANTGSLPRILLMS